MKYSFFGKQRIEMHLKVDMLMNFVNYMNQEYVNYVRLCLHFLKKVLPSVNDADSSVVIAVI